jgi:MSHA biogenesis protein MshP
MMPVPTQLPGRQRGVGLVTAIFLLVVIAGLAVAMVTVFTAQQAGSQLDQQGTRAYQAARAGIEWGLFRARQANTCETRSFRLPDASNLRAFTVTVNCTSTSVPAPDSAPALETRIITATACNDPLNGACPNAKNSLDYVQRQIQVQF